ncbi:hypothetical protein ACFL27_22250 [candidate division CSSED10-310 bacterium]|uniref:Uncharacterized protein n=1 Tax=candidate division CSSED10-310 bacterium TaxID=2855610 RepID=A0ABV6Z3B7_UNCC1
MKKVALIITFFLLLSPSPVLSVGKDFAVPCKVRIDQGEQVISRWKDCLYTFRVEVISDDAGRKPHHFRDGKPFIYARPGERYRVRIHNPLPVRVAANLTIDGLNSITGSPCKPANGRKWIIEPHSYVDIKGWQVSYREARRFYFTSKAESYARWRSNKWGKDLTVNCGVIGVAYFWSRQELENYQNRYTTIYPESEYAEKSKRIRPPAPDQPQAGTGMGEQESHPVQEIHFDYDSGMYRIDQAVMIYYDFPKKYTYDGPMPFEQPEPGDFAPEQPYR